MTVALTDLFPPISPYATHDLAVGGGHRLYVEECGNPEGLPAVFLHGGPGAGCDPDHRRFFDPRALPDRAFRPAWLRPLHARMRNSPE